MHLREATVRDLITEHGPGTIGIYTDHIARFSDFTVSIQGLLTPPGTEFAWSRGVYLAYNTNRFIREMSDDSEWLFLMDDDHRFDPDILMKLLDHDLDVVVATTSKKFPPYEPVLYERSGELTDPNFGHTPISLNGKSGLVEIDACGKPGMLIKRSVLDSMSDPWCEYRDSEQGAEDIDFCIKIKEQTGVKIYADLDTQLSHMVAVAVTKAADPNGNWGSMLSLGQDKGVFLPD